MARYAWPSRPILNRDEAAERLATALATAWDDLEAERRAVAQITDQTRAAALRKRVAEFEQAITRFSDDVQHHLDRFIELHMAPNYLAGVRQGGGAGVFNLIHQQAFTALATDTYTDFLERSVEAGRVSEKFARAVRRAAAQELPKIAAGGVTARQAGRKLADRLTTDFDIRHVTYADGTRMPVKHFADMLARTKSAVAYNAGTLNEAKAAGVEYMEVFDGADCGWDSHQSPDKAAGSIRSVDECAMAPISHPRCQRGFGPRPDVTSKTAAKRATPSTTAPQRVDQIGVDYFAGNTTVGRQAAIQRSNKIAARQARAAGQTPSAADKAAGKPGRAPAAPPPAAADLPKRLTDKYPQMKARPATLTDLDREVAVVNPNYDRGHDWQINCQNCTNAQELRWRGLDVEAAPVSAETKRSVQDLAEEWMFPDGHPRAGDTEVFRPVEIAANPSRFATPFKDWMDGLADGERGFIVNEWKGPGRDGHIINYRKVGDDLMFYDGQPGKTITLDQFRVMMSTRFRAKRMYALRTDDKIPDAFQMEPRILKRGATEA